MLVLTRRVNETLYIGDDIKVTVGRIEGDTVRLLIQAPRQVAVYRAELYERVKAANRQAALPPDASAAAALPKLERPT